MLKITNKTDRKIQLEKNLNLNPYQEISIHSSITSKIAQLERMGIISVKELSISNDSSYQNKEKMSANKKRRQERLERIKQGDVQPSVNLSEIASANIDDLFVNKPKRGRNPKNKR